MPSFARIDGTNTVTDIFTLDNGDCLDASGNHSSTIGAAMCEQKKAGTWIESAEKNKEGLRGNYAGIGYTYMTGVQTLGVASTDIFISQPPYPSWTGISTVSAEWLPPITRPTETDSQVSNHEIYNWDETAYQADNTKGWVLTSAPT